MIEKTITLILAVFPIVWGIAMMLYMRKRPEKLRMSYPEFRIMCLFFIVAGLLLTCFVALNLI